jgi:hypothetical protein
LIKSPQDVDGPTNEAVAPRAGGSAGDEVVDSESDSDLDSDDMIAMDSESEDDIARPTKKAKLTKPNVGKVSQVKGSTAPGVKKVRIFVPHLAQGVLAVHTYMKWAWLPALSKRSVL